MENFSIACARCRFCVDVGVNIMFRVSCLFQNHFLTRLCAVLGPFSKSFLMRLKADERAVLKSNYK